MSRERDFLSELGCNHDTTLYITFEGGQGTNNPAYGGIYVTTLGLKDAEIVLDPQVRDRAVLDDGVRHRWLFWSGLGAGAHEAQTPLRSLENELNRFPFLNAENILSDFADRQEWAGYGEKKGILFTGYRGTSSFQNVVPFRK